MNARCSGWLVLGGLVVAIGCSGEPPPDPPFGPFCGGFAGIPCPGAGDCLDDPRDDCDPSNGGADCGGVCVCGAIGLCEEGFEWDSSPEVCGCVEATNPCAAVLCPVGTECVAEGDDATCVPITGGECGDQTCGAGLVCCNASCGICTPPGGVCIQIACD
jgi:hypothetical protein